MPPRLRVVLGALPLLSVAFLAAGGPLAVGAAAAGSVSAVTSCANPHLPAEILAGDGPLGGAEPLPVVDASAGDVKLRLAVANDDATRELGLMCVTRLRPHAGMIFVFQQTAAQEFWMKHTLIPLDMVWVTADGTVTYVAADVPASTMQTPDDQVARRTGNGRYVIELPAREALADGIAIGTHLTVPPLTAGK
jgi:uncharacterized membrane protein (UPF0127 family)